MRVAPELDGGSRTGNDHTGSPGSNQEMARHATEDVRAVRRTKRCHRQVRERAMVGTRLTVCSRAGLQIVTGTQDSNLVGEPAGSLTDQPAMSCRHAIGHRTSNRVPPTDTTVDARRRVNSRGVPPQPYRLPFE